MREIKFRSWLKIKKVMLIEFTMDNKLDSESEKNVLMQYTGLKDTNSKDIYEGDVVDYLGDIELVNSNVLRVIEYKNEEACFVARLPVGVEGEEAVYLNEHDFKVIGNIYENPELVEATA